MYTYFDFDRIRPGAYRCAYRYGYEAILVKMDGMWHGMIRNDLGEYVGGTNVCERLLKDAKHKLHLLSADIMVESLHLLTREKISVSIATPAHCDPSTETYHSM